MSLDSFVKITAVPELFERLQADAEQFRGDLERLQRFVELAMAKQVVAPAFNPVAKEQDLDSWLQEDEWQKADSLSAFVDGSSTDTSLAPNSVVDISKDRATAWAKSTAISPDPQPSTPAPVEMESIARQRLEQDAQEAAQRMVVGFDSLKLQKQSTATSLAYALRIAREASAGFECHQTMVAIQRALYGMDAAAREAQNTG